MPATAQLIPGRQHIAMLLAPRCVVDLGDNRFEYFPACIKAIVETNRVEAVAKVTQVGQKADRATGPGAGVAGNQVANRIN